MLIYYLLGTTWYPVTECQIVIDGVWTIVPVQVLVDNQWRP